MTREQPARNRDAGVAKITSITWRAGAAGVAVAGLLTVALGHHADAPQASHEPGHYRDPSPAASARRWSRPGDLGRIMTADQITRDTFEVFGTTAVLLVTSTDAVVLARSIADRVLADVDLACSRFRPDSELSRLNAADGEPLVISLTFADLLAAALRAARLTGGDVDPTCGRALTGLGYDRDFSDVRAASDVPPPLTGPVGPVGPVPGWRQVRLDHGGRRVRLGGAAQLDLGATAKAWAADKCAEQIADSVGCGVLVSLGGDVAVAGEPPPAAGGSG